MSQDVIGDRFTEGFTDRARDANQRLGAPLGARGATMRILTWLPRPQRSTTP